MGLLRSGLCIQNPALHVGYLFGHNRDSNVDLCYGRGLQNFNGNHNSGVSMEMPSFTMTVMTPFQSTRGEVVTW